MKNGQCFRILNHRRQLKLSNYRNLKYEGLKFMTSLQGEARYRSRVSSKHGWFIGSTNSTGKYCGVCGHLLVNRGVLDIDIKTNRFSQWKKNSKHCTAKLLSIHPSTVFEASLMDIVLRHRSKLWSLVRTKRSKKKRGNRKKSPKSNLVSFLLSCFCHLRNINWFGRSRTCKWWDQEKWCCDRKTNQMRKKLSNTCKSVIAKKEFVFNCISCGFAIHMNKFCTGLSDSNIAGPTEISQNVLLFCSCCSYNNRQELVINSFSTQSSTSNDKLEAVNETLECFKEQFETMTKDFEELNKKP